MPIRVERLGHALQTRPIMANRRPLGQSSGNTTLIKTDLGTKRICPSCAARFYDLQRRPIECPKCNYTFEPEMLLKQRRTRVPEPVSKPAEAVAEEEETDEAEDEAAPAGEDEN